MSQGQDSRDKIAVFTIIAEKLMEDEWIKFGRRLGLSDNDLDEEHVAGKEENIIRILQKWDRWVNLGANMVPTLEAKLKAIGRGDVASLITQNGPKPTWKFWSFTTVGFLILHSSLYCIFYLENIQGTTFVGCLSAWAFAAALYEALLTRYDVK